MKRKEIFEINWKNFQVFNLNFHGYIDISYIILSYLLLVFTSLSLSIPFTVFP